jgi:hypothetical protein
MNIKTHLCIDKDDLLQFIGDLKAGKLVSVKEVNYPGADGRLYEFEVRYR